MGGVSGAVNAADRTERVPKQDRSRDDVHQRHPGIGRVLRGVGRAAFRSATSTLLRESRQGAYRAHLRAGNRGAEVGGDWYDVLALPHSAVGRPSATSWATMWKPPP